MMNLQQMKRCAGCHNPIRTRYLVLSLGKEWHENCLRCDICKETLYRYGENKLYFKKGRMLCRADYMRLYAAGGECSMCKQNIPPSEKVMKFKNNLNYHLTCFYCVYCQYRFSVGDSVHIPKPNIILCQRHWIQNQGDTDSRDSFGSEDNEVMKMMDIS